MIALNVHFHLTCIYFAQICFWFIKGNSRSHEMCARLRGSGFRNLCWNLMAAALWRTIQQLIVYITLFGLRCVFHLYVWPHKTFYFPLR